MAVRDASTPAVQNGSESTQSDQFSRALLSAMLALKEGDFAGAHAVGLDRSRRQDCRRLQRDRAVERAPRPRDRPRLATPSARKASSNSA